MKAKYLYTAIILLAVLILNSNAQQLDEKKFESIVDNFYESLTHENLGVVESSIFITIQFKNKFPNEDPTEFVEALDEISRDSEIARISYKAHLAKIYLNNFEWFKNVDVSSSENEQKIYEEIAETISSFMFATDF